MSIDPNHIEAVMSVLEQTSVSDDAHALLTSTDPAVHAALLAALVRAGMLRAQYDPGVKGIRDFPDRRRYVTRWEEIP